MALLKLDVEKSVETGWITELTSRNAATFFGVFNALINCVLLAILFALPVIMWTNDFPIPLAGRVSLNLTMLVLFFVPGVILVYGMIFKDKLYRVKGLPTIENNRNAMLDFLENEYPGSRIKEETQFIIAHQVKRKVFLAKVYGSTTRIVAIFRDENIYVNISAFDVTDAYMPFYAFFNYWMVRKLEKRFWHF